MGRKNGLDITDMPKCIRKEFALLRSALRENGFIREAQSRPDVTRDDEPAE